MPYGKGTYGSKVGRPPKKKTAAKKTNKSFMYSPKRAVKPIKKK